MKKISNSNAAHLRQLMKMSCYRDVEPDEIEKSDAQRFYSLIIPHWPQAPEVKSILEYAQEKVELPEGIYRELVNVRLTKAD